MVGAILITGMDMGITIPITTTTPIIITIIIITEFHTIEAEEIQIIPELKPAEGPTMFQREIPTAVQRFHGV